MEKNKILYKLSDSSLKDILILTINCTGPGKDQPQQCAAIASKFLRGKDKASNLLEVAGWERDI